MSDLPVYQFSASITAVNPRRNAHGTDTDVGYTVASGNGTSYFGRLPAGTPLGVVAATGLARPCGKSTVNGALIGATTIVVNEAENFYVGDEVSFYDAATGALIATKTLTGVDKTAKTVTFTGAITVGDGDPVYLTGGAGVCVGVLLSEVNTFNKDLGPVGGYTNVACTVGWHGSFWDTKLVGGNALIKADLPAARFF